MNFLEFTTFINTIAATMASCLSEEELAIWAATFTQIGDTLATIAVIKSIKEDDEI